MTSCNINAHYTSNPKVEKPITTAISAPNTMPASHQYYNYKEADKKLSLLGKEVNNSLKKEEKSEAKNFIKVFGGIVVTILGIKGIQKIISFFK